MFGFYLVFFYCGRAEKIKDKKNFLISEREQITRQNKQQIWLRTRARKVKT